MPDHEIRKRSGENDANPWRETVRDLYDLLHFGPDNMFTPTGHIAARIVVFIEDRHPDFFRASAKRPE